jgi:REP element-mobilizing transposase RayT
MFHVNLPSGISRRIRCRQGAHVHTSCRTFAYVPTGRREQLAGCIYHVSSRGNLRAPIFLTDDGRGRFLGLLERACHRDGLVCHAYCLMGNHYHLLVETPNANLGKAMHRINSGYVQWFNLQHGSEGHLFERRYRSWIMRGQDRQMEAVRYIVRNPVRAGLCHAPESWLWSSHAATAGLARRPPFLTVDTVRSWFGGDAEAAVRYRCYVDEGVDQPQERPALELLVARGTVSEIAAANRVYGYSLRQIAAVVGVSPATLSRRLRNETLATGAGVSASEAAAGGRASELLGREAVLDRRPAAGDL